MDPPVKSVDPLTQHKRSSESSQSIVFNICYIVKSSGGGIVCNN